MKQMTVAINLSKLCVRMVILFGVLAFSLTACGKKEEAVDTTKEKAATDSSANEKEMLLAAVDAYVYAYPLLTMEYTRRALTNTVNPEGTKAPMGQFVRLRTYPDASFKDVTAPNADTLYTTAWFDVSKEPGLLVFRI